MKSNVVIGIFTTLFLVAGSVGAQADNRPAKTYSRRPTPAGVIEHFDLPYAEVDGEALKLDLYLPKHTTTKPPLILWIHGGGWRNGDKVQFNPAVMQLSTEGYAVASINYRLGGLQLHPKQIHDCKGALRWLRAHADEYGYDATRVAVGGGSAGGHLALLLGLTGGVEAMEGTVGGNLEFAGPVQAILDLYGPSDLTRMPKRVTDGHDNAMLREVTPLNYLDENDPPVLIFHGNQDKTVPLEQSLLTDERFKAAGLESELHIIDGAGHGGQVFGDEERHRLIKAFLEKHL